MSPANIEAELKSAGRLIGQAAVIGDGRPYNTALLVFDADGAAAWAERDGIAGRSLEALAADERDLAAVRAEGDVAIARLSRVEQIKRFHVAGAPWSPQDGQLTPTMKLRRAPIAERYAAEIEAMYAARV
jgi:long-chain acyl-CoA synthetase